MQLKSIWSLQSHITTWQGPWSSSFFSTRSHIDSLCYWLSDGLSKQDVATNLDLVKYLHVQGQEIINYNLRILYCAKFLGSQWYGVCSKIPSYIKDRLLHLKPLTTKKEAQCLMGTCLKNSVKGKSLPRVEFCAEHLVIHFVWKKNVCRTTYWLGVHRQWNGWIIRDLEGTWLENWWGRGIE